MCNGIPGDGMEDGEVEKPANTTKVLLKTLTSEKSLFNSDGKIEARFIIGHCNGATTVEQELVLESGGFGWLAQMSMNDFPRQKSVTAAAWKLADWMERMAAAIREHEFDQININSL